MGAKQKGTEVLDAGVAVKNTRQTCEDEMSVGVDKFSNADWQAQRSLSTKKMDE